MVTVSLNTLRVQIIITANIGCCSYEAAERHFSEALSRLQAIKEPVLPNKWEPLLNNLGHTYRKLQKYEEALEYHRQVRTLNVLIVAQPSKKFLALQNAEVNYCIDKILPLYPDLSQIIPLHTISTSFL
jgi:tetratricopeptide (TPR) repeat protein